MTSVETMTITVKSLGYSIRSELADFIYMTINNVYEHVDVNEDEFKSVLAGGMRNDLESSIRNHYSFVQELTIDISDSDYYDLHTLMST